MQVDLDFIVSSLCTLDTWCGGGRELGPNSSVLFLFLSLAFEKLVCLSDLLLFSLNVAVFFWGGCRRKEARTKENLGWKYGDMNTTDTFLINDSRRRPSIGGR